MAQKHTFTLNDVQLHKWTDYLQYDMKDVNYKIRCQWQQWSLSGNSHSEVFKNIVWRNVGKAKVYGGMKSLELFVVF